MTYVPVKGGAAVLDGGASGPGANAAGRLLARRTKAGQRVHGEILEEEGRRGQSG